MVSWCCGTSNNSCDSKPNWALQKETHKNQGARMWVLAGLLPQASTFCFPLSLSSPCYKPLLLPTPRNSSFHVYNSSQLCKAS